MIVSVTVSLKLRELQIVIEANQITLPLTTRTVYQIKLLRNIWVQMVLFSKVIFNAYQSQNPHLNFRKSTA